MSKTAYIDNQEYEIVEGETMRIEREASGNIRLMIVDHKLKHRYPVVQSIEPIIHLR